MIKHTMSGRFNNETDEGRMAGSRAYYAELFETQAPLQAFNDSKIPPLRALWLCRLLLHSARRVCNFDDSNYEAHAAGIVLLEYVPCNVQWLLGNGSFARFFLLSNSTGINERSIPADKLLCRSSRSPLTTVSSNSTPAEVKQKERKSVWPKPC